MVRLAKKEDIDRISEIYDHIHDKEEKGEGVVGWVRHIYPVYQTAVDGVSQEDLFVEEEDGIIVATGRINQIQLKEYADCNWLHKAAADEVMVLHTLVVDPQIDGRGYGTAFIKFYEDYALEHGCHYLRIDTQAQNYIARRFYKKLGFTEVGIVPCEFNGISDIHLVCLEKSI